MITVTHLINDAALGGVTRFLDALASRLEADIIQTRVVVSPSNRLPPAINSDIVVVHVTMGWSKLPFLLALRARRGTRPIILVEHSYSGAFEDTFVSARTRFRQMLRCAYGLVDRVVAVSYGQAAWMRRSQLLPASKLHVIQPFTACGELVDLSPPSPSQGPLKLGAYGRYCPQKGFQKLIEAMRLVEPTVASLALRGFGPDGDRLRDAAAMLPHVSVGDKIDDLADFLRATDAIVIPSIFEPFGQVAFEARLAGRPVIVTAVDGLPEQVEPAAGIVVQANDPQNIAAAIMMLASRRQSSAWQETTTAARTSALLHIPTSVERWELLLRGILRPDRNHNVRPSLIKPINQYVP